MSFFEINARNVHKFINTITSFNFENEDKHTLLYELIIFNTNNNFSITASKSLFKSFDEFKQKYINLLNGKNNINKDELYRKISKEVFEQLKDLKELIKDINGYK